MITETFALLKRFRPQAQGAIERAITPAISVNETKHLPMKARFQLTALTDHPEVAKCRDEAYDKGYAIGADVDGTIQALTTALAASASDMQVALEFKVVPGLKLYLLHKKSDVNSLGGTASLTVGNLEGEAREINECLLAAQQECELLPNEKGSLYSNLARRMREGFDRGIAHRLQAARYGFPV